MNKFITLAALLAAGTVYAHAAAETFSPLTETEGWTHTCRNGKSALWTQDTTQGTLTLSNSNWSQSVSTYDFETNVEISEFPVTVSRSDNGNAGFSFCLVGEDSVIVIGPSSYTSGALFYGLSDDLSYPSYKIGDKWDTGLGITGTKLLDDALNSNKTAVVSGIISIDASGDSIMTLTVTSDATSNVGSASINLGEGFVLDKIIIGGDGPNNPSEVWTVSNLSVSSIPEPSAFGLLAGIGALALVASRRRRK